MKKFLFTIFLALRIFPPAMAANMTANTSDDYIGLNASSAPAFPSGSVGSTTFSLGDDNAAYNKADACGVFVFQLPVLAPGESIESADLLLNVAAGWSAVGTYPIGLDLYGLRWSSNSTVLLTDYGFGAAGNAGDTLIKEDFANFPTRASYAAADYSTDAAGDAALVAWLNAQYTAGATGGDYIFLRAQPDRQITGALTINSANNTDKPELSYTILSAGLTANAGPDQSVMDSDNNDAETITLDGTGSGGTAGTITGYVWELNAAQIATGATASVSLNVGTHIITLTVTDDLGESDSDTVEVVVLPFSNLSPTADAGNDQNMEDSDDSGGETVTLDGSGSIDSDGSITSYIWEVGGSQIASGVTAQVSLDVGTHLVTLVVTDNSGGSDSDTVQIVVEPFNPFTGTTVAIDSQTSYQTILGYEVLNKLPPFITPELKDEIIETLVNDLGINRLRCEIPAGNTAEGQRWEWLNDNGDPDDLDWTGLNSTEMDGVIMDMVLPFKQRVEARGEPFDMVVHYSFYPGGSSGDAQAWMYNSPGENAEYAVSLLKRLRDVHGVETPYLCVKNEPTYNNPWTPGQIQEIIKVTGPRLEAEGFKTKIEYPETQSIDAAWDNFIVPTMDDDEMWSHVGLISYHRYGLETHHADIGAFGLSRNIPVGQTEGDYLSTDKLYTDMTLGNCSYWSFYLIQSQIPIYGDDFDRLSYDSWYWRLRQMSHYVRPGALRIDAVSDNAAVKSLAFLKDGKITTVLFTGFDGITRTVRLTGLPPGDYGVSQARSANAYTELGIQTVDASGIIDVSIPPGSALTVYPYSGSNEAPTVTQHVSSNTFLVAPASSLTLSASATDPEQDAISYQWSVSKSPGGAAVNLATPHAATCAVSNLTVPGKYAFRLEVSDGTHTVVREVRSNVYATDPPPIVWNVHNRNPLVVTLPNTQTVLRGGAWDHGNNTTTFQWSVISQPAGASAVLATPTTSPCPVDGLSVPGDYVFRLAVSDGLNTVSKDLTITVYPANNAPAIHSASSSSNALTLPDSAVTLTSTTSDADSDTITHWWRCTSMPAGAHPVFSAQGQQTTQVSGLIVPGSYTFQLTVADETDVTKSSAIHVTVGAGASPEILDLYVPGGGETFSFGQSVNIRWSSYNFTGDVKVEFFNGGSWSVIFASVPNDGIEAWTVPSSAISGGLIRISDAADADPMAESPSSFSIIGSHPKIDADSDAMADDWEVTHFGNILTASALTDSDSDGFDDPSEYAADTDPDDGNSLLRIEAVRVDAGGITVNWQGGIGAKQYLEYRPGLNSGDPDWQTIRTYLPPTATAGEESDLNLPGNTPMFRIRVER